MTNMSFLKTQRFRNMFNTTIGLFVNSTGHCCEFVYVLVDDFQTLKLIVICLPGPLQMLRTQINIMYLMWCNRGERKYVFKNCWQNVYEK